MLNWLRKILVLPEFPSEETTRMARQLNAIYLVSIVFFLGVDILLAVIGYPLNALTYWIFLGLALVVAILLVVMRHGYLRQTAALFIAVCFVALVVNAGTQTGIYDSTFLGMTAVILLAGVLLGPWGLLTFTALSILAGFALAYIAKIGLISHPLDTPLNTAIYLTGIFIINAIFAYLAISNLNTSIKHTRDSESKLLVSNNELITLRASLEMQVEERTAELAKANEQSQRRARKFEAVAEVARVTTVRRDPTHLLSEMTSMISEHFGYYHVGIFLLEEGGKYAALRASNSLGGNQMLAKKFHIDLADGSLTSLAITSGKMQVAQSADFNYPDLPATHSEAILPLKVGERVTGALDIHSEVVDAFTPEDIEILNILADQAAIILEDARLFSETAQALSESRATYGQYLRQAWDKLPLEINLAGFQYADGKTNPLENPIDRPEIQSAFKAGETVSNIAKSNVLAIPLKLRDQVIGVLDIRSNSSANFSESQLSLIRAIAERVSLALENARLFEETTRRADRERKVSEISNHIRSVSDPAIMLQTALDELKHALGANDIQIRPYSRPPVDQNIGTQIDPIKAKPIHPTEAI